MRREFGKALSELAVKEPKIFLLSGDYESGVDSYVNKFPDRYLNLGTCEQSLIGVAAGMAMEGFIPVVYSITPFILERPFELIKICIDQQNLHVILVGYDDYPTQGPTHKAINPKVMISLFENIKGYFPKNSLETKEALIDAIKLNHPAFIGLKRDRSIK
jgi:transketolase